MKETRSNSRKLCMLNYNLRRLLTPTTVKQMDNNSIYEAVTPVPPLPRN